MPAGKALIVGGSFPLPDLPDCACEELLLRDRKKQHPSINAEDRAKLLATVNRALRIYVGRSNAVPVPTQTDVTKAIRKVVLAAQRLLIALRTKNTARISHWQNKFAEQIVAMEPAAYQVLEERFIAQCSGAVPSQAIQDFVESISATRANDFKRAIEVIAAIKPDEVKLNGFPDPHLPDLVCELAVVWRRVTGRKPLPTSVSKDSSEKIYLFVEWIREMVRTANKALCRQRMQRRTDDARPVFRLIKTPKEGAIFDIACRVGRSQK